MSVVRVVFGPNGSRVREGRRDPFRALELATEALAMLDDPNKHRLAMHSFESALSFDPECIEGLVNFAWLLTESQQFKDFDRAETLLNAALKVEPSNVVALYNLGTLNMRRMNVDEAVLNLSFVIKNSSPNDQIHYDATFNLATIYDRCGLCHSAVKNWRRVLELRPRCPEANFIRFRIAQHESNV